MSLNIPTTLTWIRIALIPAFVGVYYLPHDWLTPTQQNWTGAWIFTIAAITDWADGFAARRLKQSSAFGAFLDPVADKLMVAAALLLLVQMKRADASGATYAVVIGDDEAAAGEVSLKPLRSGGEQIRIPMEILPETLADRLLELEDDDGGL